MHFQTDRGDRPVTQPSTSARPAMAETVAWVYCALGAAMVVALVALRDTELAAAPVAVMGLGAAIAAAVGSVRNRPQVATPWRLFSLACMAFIVGAVLRQVLADSPISALADVATLSGYAATLSAFICLLRCRQSSDRAVHELVDGAIVSGSGRAPWRSRPSPCPPPRKWACRGSLWCRAPTRSSTQ